MPFTVRVGLLGVGGYVLDKAPANQATKLMVVMVNATKTGNRQNKRALDDSYLSQHRALVRIPQKNLPAMAGLPGTGDFIWYIENQRITLDSDLKPPLTFVGAAGAASAVPGLGSLEDFGYVPKFAPITPLGGPVIDVNAIDPSAVVASPPTDLVIAQVLVDSGIVGCVDTRATFWDYQPAIPGITAPAARLLGHRLVVDLEVNQQFRLRAIPFGGGQSEDVTVVPAPGENHVELTIGNLCAENTLEWQGEPARPDPDGTLRDHDFKWCYELCRDRDLLRQYLADLRVSQPHVRSELPVPVAVGGVVGTLPVMCYRPQFQAVAF